MSENQLKRKIQTSSTQKRTIPQWVWFYLAALGLILLWGYLSRGWMPVSYDVHSNQEVGLRYEDVTSTLGQSPTIRRLLEPWLRWDTEWYMKIAKVGYQPQGNQLAFPPVYPLLIRGLSNLLGGEYLLAALMISWAAFFGVCYLLYERIKQTQGENQARNGLTFLLWFPTAFFFFAGYTESLFLLLALLAWQQAEEKNWLWAGVIGTVATFTKFAGISLFLPFVYMWWKIPSRKISLQTTALGLIPLAYFGWSGYAKNIYGITPSDALHAGWGMNMTWPWLGILAVVKDMFITPINLNYYFYFDTFSILLTIFAIFWWLKKEAFPEALFMASILGLALMKVGEDGYIYSVSRYILPLFPIYTMLPMVIKKPFTKTLLLSISVVLYMFCATLYFLWGWIA